MVFVNPLCPLWLIFTTKKTKTSRSTRRFRKNKILFGGEFCTFTFRTTSKKCAGKQPHLGQTSVEKQANVHCQPLGMELSPHAVHLLY